MPRCLFLLTLVLAGFLFIDPAWAGKAFDSDEVSGRQLIDYLDHPDWHYRFDAAEEIGDRKIIQAEASLARLAVEDGSERVRRVALDALREVGSDKLVATAEEVSVGDSDAGNRIRALEIIEDQGSASSARVLGQVLVNDADSDVRRKAAVILAKKAWSGAGEALKQAALSDPESQVRAAARRALMKAGGPDLRGVLHQIMRQDPDEDVRLEIVEMLEEAPTRADRDALVGALDDSNPHVARHAARALVRLGDRTVAPLLREKALDVTDLKVAEEFNEAAAKLGG